MISISAHPLLGTVPSPMPKNEAEIRHAAQQLEATFLAEMLKSAGAAGQSSAFHGSAGEAHFSTFLSEKQAGNIVEAGGLGLTEAIIQAIVEADHGRT